MPKKKALSLSPVIWKQYEDNVKILDVSADNIERTCDFVIKHTKEFYSIFKQMDIETIAVDFRLYIEQILCEGCSMMLFNEKQNEIMGVAILLPMLKSYKTWTALEATATSNVIQLYVRLFRHMLSEGYKNEITTDSVHIFSLSLDDQYRGKNYKVDLIHCAERLASSMNIPRVTFISYTGNNQDRSLRAGMIEKYRIYFASYFDSKTKTQPFQVASKAEWYTILFEKIVAESKPYYKY